MSLNKIAVDFDGVIHDYKNIPKGRKLGPAIEGTKESIEELRNQGYEIILFSYWATPENRKILEDWLVYFQIPVDEITNIKPNCDFYIDDHGVKFTNWNEVLNIINNE